jgi:hypothetical protein
MSVSASTDIYFNRREEFLPILRLLFLIGWCARNFDDPNSFTWFPPGFYEDCYDQDGNHIDIPENDIQELKLNQLEKILDKIYQYDQNKNFHGTLSISLLFPYQKSCCQKIRHNDHFTNIEYTGGSFIMEYSLDKPRLCCSWNVNRLLIDNQKGVTNFAFYHEKLKIFFDAYQTRIKKIIDQTDW